MDAVTLERFTANLHLCHVTKFTLNLLFPVYYSYTEISRFTSEEFFELFLSTNILF